MEADEAQKIEKVIREIVDDDRYYHALTKYIESKKVPHLSRFSKRRKGSAADDADKLADANSSYATLTELLSDLANKRTNKGTT